MISVIVPTLDEAANLARLLPALAAPDGDDEVIVADGGSRDGTVALARAHGARVVSALRGRGAQLHAGARAARGETLLFLHADTLFPAGGLAAVGALMAASPGIVGGNFRVVFDGASRFSRRLTTVYNGLRGRGLYYGDSGIFARRAVYQAIGGFRPYPVMEDYDFVARLEACGETRRIDDPALIVSTRKFEGRPGYRVVWGWLVLHALYHLGVSPERLARLYYPERR